MEDIWACERIIYSGHSGITAINCPENVGFVYTGQGADLEVEDFRFTRHRLQHDRVIGVSRVTMTEDQCKPHDTGHPPSHKQNGQPPSGSPAYAARMPLDKASLIIDGEERQRGPGMAEIKAESRRIIDSFLPPIRVYRQGSFTGR